MGKIFPQDFTRLMPESGKHFFRNTWQWGQEGAKGTFPQTSTKATPGGLRKILSPFR
jgi:hypothetical protein